jgi:hypothetical protein
MYKNGSKEENRQKERAKKYRKWSVANNEMLGKVTWSQQCRHFLCSS